MKIESLMTIIGSGGLIALISTFLTKLGTDKGYEVKHIVDERKLWRQEIRTEVERIGNARTTVNLKKFKTFLTIRLNPKDTADKKILKAIDELLKENNDENWNTLLDGISKLLKHDWERSKKEVRTANIIIQIISFSFYTKCILSQDWFEKLFYDWHLDLVTLEKLLLATSIYFLGILSLHIFLKNIINRLISIWYRW